MILEGLMSPGAMTRSQWMIVGMLGFIVVGAGYFVWRLVSIIQSATKSTYVPNIGLSRIQKERAQAKTSTPLHPAPSKKGSVTPAVVSEDSGSESKSGIEKDEV